MAWGCPAKRAYKGLFATSPMTARTRGYKYEVATGQIPGKLCDLRKKAGEDDARSLLARGPGGEPQQSSKSKAKSKPLSDYVRFEPEQRISVRPEPTG